MEHKMTIIGDKSSFAIGLGKDIYAYQLSVFVQGNDILQIEKDGVICPYRWRECQDIIEWIQENMKYIMSDDKFPFPITAPSAAEKNEICLQLDWDEIEKYEILQDWTFRHCWFSARASSYLANIFFVRNDNTIEISWDNTNTFERVGIRCIFPKGRYEVDKDVFEEIMRGVCAAYAHRKKAQDS